MSLKKNTIKFSALVKNSGGLTIRIGLAATLCATTALAQVPTSVNPANIEKRFEQQPQAFPSTGKASPVQTPATGLTKEQEAKLSKQRFTLKSVSIQGNTVYSDADLAFAYEGLKGKTISLLDAQGIATRITEFYRKNGYILSQAILPKQNVSDGTLNVQVVEGYIGNVVIGEHKENHDYSHYVESYAEKLKSKRPVKVTNLERYLLLMDDLPGATARGLVQPSSSIQGAADLSVEMEHKTYEGSYTMDNRGSKFVGPIQHTATFAANSILGMYDRTVARYITTSPVKELNFIDLQHEEQVGSEGTRLLFTGSYSHSEPGDSLKFLEIESDGYFFQGKMFHPYIRSRAENFVVRGMFDTRYTVTDVSGINISKDRLNVLRAGAAYDFADAWQGVNLIDGEIAHGFDIWGATDTGINRSRTDGEADFTKVNLDLTRTQALRGNWSLFGSASGQYSFDRLLAAEQYTLGGAVFGRAYDPAEITGDHGLAGRAELRYGEASEGPYLTSWQVYGFYDVGRVWTRDGSPNSDHSLASTGAGVRTNFSEHLSGDFQVAVPLTRDASNQGGHGEDPRLFFSVTGRF